MLTFLASRIDALGGWRAALGERLAGLSRFLVDNDLAEATAVDAIAALRQRLASDKIVLAFVAEFSRGKSELINAIFFAGSGRRLLPAAPGRTTMCPVEIAHDASQPPSLALLPIETRLGDATLADYALRDTAWTRTPLDTADPERLAASLLEVMRIQRVSPDAAAALGLWHDDEPDDNPPLGEDGLVEVPVWRHALINYPHPLLDRGLIVIDTPGLNALGAEPELTLGLLPGAHATVFILAADAGVTRSDLRVWREHLGVRADAQASGARHFAVLNKIDVLRDPLLGAAEVELQIEAQRADTARLLDLPPDHVFALSAREALVARATGDALALERSRLPDLELALGEQLLGQRQQVLAAVVEEGVRGAQSQTARHIGEKRRLVTEQLVELRGLRGKSGTRHRMMLQRLTAEAAEFESCTTRLRALRAVHSRMQAEATAGLSREALKAEVERLDLSVRSVLLNFGARTAFTALCRRMEEAMHAAQTRGEELHAMLDGSFAQLNAEFGFALALAGPPNLSACIGELETIERNYAQYLGLRQALRLSDAKFAAQFRRMLLTKLRVVFETAVAEMELWNKAASAQVDMQLRERRTGYRRRRDALERIEGAAGGLEQRIAELEAQDRRLIDVQARLDGLAGSLREFLRAVAGSDDPAWLPSEPMPL